jgi:hypothetical protein
VIDELIADHFTQQVLVVRRESLLEHPPSHGLVVVCAGGHV